MEHHKKWVQKAVHVPHKKEGWSRMRSREKISADGHSGVKCCKRPFGNVCESTTSDVCSDILKLTSKTSQRIARKWSKWILMTDVKRVSVSSKIFVRILFNYFKFILIPQIFIWLPATPQTLLEIMWGEGETNKDVDGKISDRRKLEVSEMTLGQSRTWYIPLGFGQCALGGCLKRIMQKAIVKLHQICTSLQNKRGNLKVLLGITDNPHF